MEGRVEEVRRGRSLWVAAHPAAGDGELAAEDAVALLVHGSCANALQFREQVGPLQRAGVATVAYDAYGCGSSAKPREYAAYAPGELYADLEAMYERYGKRHRAVFLVAHSIGTCLAVRLAARLGGALAGLVLVGAFHPAFGGTVGSRLFLLPEMVLGWLQPTLTRSFMALAFHEDTRRTRPDLIAREAAYSNANPPHMFRAFYRQAGLFFEPVGAYDELLRGVAAPALVIGGEGDRLTPLQPMGARVAALLPRARLVSLPRAGHQDSAFNLLANPVADMQVHQEQPDAFNRELLAFMRECLSDSGT